jgi:Tol biopolymer transport system component/DNA-binding winged helix-turn-helix (wHTH) protein
MSNKTKRIYEFGPFRLDAGEHLLLRDGAAVPLTPKALDLLLALVERHGHLQEKEELFKAVWPDTIVEESNLSSHIAVIRKALGEGGNGARYIETVPKRGYRFAAEVRDVTPVIKQTRSPEHAESNVDATLPADDAKQVRRVGHWMRPVALLALGIFVVAGIWWGVIRRTPPLPPIRVTPFTTLPGKEGQPCFSPDGNQIAFVWDGEQGNNQDIYVKLIGSETPLRLTADPAADSDPAWSPDGRSIAFLRQAAGRSGYYVVPAIGGPERKVADAFQTEQHWFGRRLNYAPDSKSLVVADKSSAAEPFSLFLLSTETGERRRLTSPSASDPDVGDRHPAFSPDGKWIAFSRSLSPGVSDVYLAPVAGGAPVRLTFDNVLTQDLAWTPDGREIIFISTREGGPSLWRISATGGAPQLLMGVGRNEYSFAISSQGNRLAYLQKFSDSNICRLELSNSATQSRRPTKMISSTVEDHSPQYSPDGKRIVFVSTRSGNHEIWLCDSEGANPVQLTNLGGRITGTPRWSPDGRLIAFDSRPEGNADLFVINPESRLPRRLTTEPSGDIVPSWSRDGQWIYFSSNRNGNSQIWKLPVAGGSAVQVTRQGGFEGFESTDGKFFYFAKGRNIPGLWRVPTEGGEETPILDHHRAGYWRYWAIVEQGIYFATAEKPEQPLIEFFSFGAGRISPVAILEKPILNMVPGLAVAPDGRWLIWSQLDQEASDIMLLENFR